MPRAIGNQVEDFLDQHQIDHVAIEQTIYVQNFQTAQILGAARGAAIAAAAMRGLPVFEYAPPYQTSSGRNGTGQQRTSSTHLEKYDWSRLRISL